MKRASSHFMKTQGTKVIGKPTTVGIVDLKPSW